ncbi:STAS/SEC14 domain-containing protein [Hymenobacter sp. 15J16-1T3B]|uniref:STAS/SEC14 domain-containing protein n=1 Tax=Hymenobacter sp. 15J16-1T3B TaxID=2886941 RepID=UPI001D11F8F3|nr:STAS/SEC14 domain-containing protein [Hymenobacter sp. 15J16-1T3B]MCC3160720.1 STAS/SEC14 domain-containing protein [Hymenobacter sp. 15J16-1T3B]
MGQQSIFFHNAAGRLHDDDRGFLRITWHPNVLELVARRELMEQALEWLQRYGHGRILADQRFIAPFSPTEQQWIQEHWTPRALQAGYRRRAVLAAHDALARLSAAAILMPIRDHISYCYFDNEGEAIAWLLAQ